MNKIITIGREFGSGGREVGKRLADALGYDYYDHEIIQSIVLKSGYDEKISCTHSLRCSTGFRQNTVEG